MTFRLARLLLCSGLAALLGTAPISSQPRPSSVREPRFEVTSVKQNTSGVPNVGAAGDRFANGQYRSTNIPLRLLLRQAFERWRPDDVVGGPSWLDTDRWDIAAKAESPSADMLPMIRSLIVDRFGLDFHIETKEGPVYELVVARQDRRLGPSLKRNAGEPYWLGTTGRITGRAIPIEQFARLIGAEVQRKVIDRTSLDGTYDVEILFTRAGVLPSSSDLPDIFTALQEQLGLRLVATRGRVDHLVIDRVERPDPD